MRLQMLLPKVEPDSFIPPMECPYDGCPGTHFRAHPEVAKVVRDTRYEHVTAWRYECLRCHRTFRVYPVGVTRAHVSLRVKGLAVMFYLLGLSYGGGVAGAGSVGGAADKAANLMRCKSSVVNCPIQTTSISDV